MEKSSCCKYTIVYLEINHEQKPFCLNCGKPCGVIVIKSRKKEETLAGEPTLV